MSSAAILEPGVFRRYASDQLVTLAKLVLENAFQPIVEVNNGATFGYESLLRGHGELGFKSPLELIDRMAETAGPAVQRLQDGVQAAGETLTQRATEAREAGDEWVEGLRSTVREHPLAALATALAVGVLVSRLAR